MSEPRAENLSYTLTITQSQLNEAVTDWLKRYGKIPADDSAEAYVKFLEDDGYGHALRDTQLDVQASVTVKVHDAKSLINVLRL